MIISKLYRREEGWLDWTYRKEEVHNIHQAQHHIGHIVEIVDIGGGQERAGNDVVRKHLVVVLPSLLDMDNED